MTIPTSQADALAVGRASVNQLDSIRELRDPTSFDGINGVFPLHQRWVNYATNLVWELTNFTSTAGVQQAVWTQLGVGVGPINTINGVPPVAGNIDIIDQSGAGAITVSAPGSAGAGTVGLGVNVDNTTITIVGDQLTVTGAIVGSVVTTVNAATTTILSVPMGVVSRVTQFDILIAAYNVTANAGSGYSIIATIRTDGAAATKCLLTAPNPPNQFDVTTNEENAMTACFVQVDVSGNNMVVLVNGIAGQTIQWIATARTISVP